MDFVNLTDQSAGFLDAPSYVLYVLFTAVMFLPFSQFKPLLTEISIKPVRIAITLFAINFFVAFYSLDQNIPMFLVIIFYATMISPPALLLCNLEYIQQQQQQLLIANDDDQYDLLV